MKLECVFAVSALLALVGCANTLQPKDETSWAGNASSYPAKIQVAATVVPSEVLNPDVRQETIDVTICVPGYTASIRPSTSFTNGVKGKLLREAGQPPDAAPEYELDHHVALALGGHPRNLRNLALQRWEGEDGAKKKDVLEKRLQKLVCARPQPALSLAAAQWAIFSDWKQAYRKYVAED